MFEQTERFMLEYGVPTSGSYNAPVPAANEAAWDQPPPADQEQLYSLRAAPGGYPEAHGRWMAVASTAPSRMVELHDLNFNLHRMVPDAAGVLALGSVLRIIYRSAYYELDEDGLVPPDALPRPATCCFMLPNTRLAGVDIRAYDLGKQPQRDDLRADRDIDFDMAGRRRDLLPSGAFRVADTGEQPLITQREAETLRAVVDLLPDLPERNWLARFELETTQANETKPTES